MKKIFISILIIFLLFIASCKKNDKTNDTNNIDNNSNSNNNEQEDPNDLAISFNQDHYVYGDIFSYTSTKYQNSDMYLTIDDENALDPNGDGTYTVQRTGTYNVKIALKMDPTISLTKEFHFYRVQFEIETTSNRIMVGDTCDLNIYSFDDLYEKSDNDFIYTVNDETKARIDNHSLIALAIGDVEVTLTSKINSKVKSSVKIKICDPNEEFIFKPVDGDKNIEMGETISIYYSLDYSPKDFEWSSSDKEILRVTKYDTSVEVTGVGEGKAYINCYLKSNPKIKSTYQLKVSGYNGIDYIDKFIKLAYEQVGIVEGKDEFDRYNNEQKFGAWYGNNGQPWCATFVSWCWFHAGLSNELLVKYQGCYAGMEWAHEHGIFHDIKGDYYEKEEYDPKSGDVVIFLSNGSSHTGIVGYSDSSYIYTIEGNRSNKVAVWRISKNHASITGYIEPHYPQANTRIDQSWLKTTKKNGVYIWTDITTGLSTE